MQAPTPFWDSPAFTTAAVLLMGAIIAYIQSRIASKQDRIAQKVETVEKHTNGMLSALQAKVDTQQSDATHLAEITEKDKQIAALTPKP